jgi:hypothetical protein
MKETNLDRRDFLSKSSIGLAGLAIAPGMMLFDLAHGRALGEPASNKVRWGMLIDNNYRVQYREWTFRRNQTYRFAVDTQGAT